MCYVVYCMTQCVIIKYDCVLRGVVSLLRDLKHANIVTLHDIIHTDSCLTLVFEYLVRIIMIITIIFVIIFYGY